MKQSHARLLAAVLVLVLLAALCPPRSAEAAAFKDVPADAWYAKAVDWAIERGITRGLNAGTFGPRRTCTRARIVTFLYRLDGQHPAGNPTDFSDVPADAWYADAVGWAESAGIVSGVGKGRFAPNALCTRGQVAAMLWRCAGQPQSGGTNPFRDVRSTDYYYQAVLWAVQKGITTGTDAAHFSPNRPCTRAQIVTFLYRMNGGRIDEPTEPEPGPLVVIDPGHQLHANPDKEPNGPGSSVMKAKVSGGTYGPASRVHEYQLNLTVGLMLRTELERRGYRVIMTRTTHDVDLSNVDRAKIGNNVHADAVVRIHANGSTDASVHGAYTINMTENNPWNANLYTKSRALSEAVLNAFCARTGARKRSIWDTDTMTGINWSTVPVTIIEMGYMSNRAEDLAMATAAYQQKMVLGIADWIDDYFGR